MSICPQQCIAMKTDCYGELHPSVNEKKCIKCMKCIKSCPVNNTPKLVEARDVYASWRVEFSKMKDSASGGVGAVLAENWIKQGGSVYGTKFDKEFHAVVCKADTLEEINAFKGSKYVQSYIGNSYNEVKILLNQGKRVLFFGTPCQLAGLYAIVDRYHPNLVSVEILCHGVSPDAYLQAQLQYLNKKTKNRTYNNLTFRTNKWMADFYFVLWNENKMVFSQQAYENEYFRGFLTGLTLRESCYQCFYKNEKRLGDILIGDFIGFAKHVPFTGEYSKPSLILVMSEKGRELLSVCRNDLVLVERTIEEALIEGRSLFESFPRHKKQRQFRELYKNTDFINAIHKTIGNELVECKKGNRAMHIKRGIKFMIDAVFGVNIQNVKIYQEK